MLVTSQKVMGRCYKCKNREPLELCTIYSMLALSLDCLKLDYTGFLIGQSEAINGDSMEM